jgi:hypothetical protein
MRNLLLLILVFLSGCAANYLRVTEYDGSIIQGGVVGCQVSQKGEVTGILIYDGEHCQYTSEK